MLSHRTATSLRPERCFLKEAGRRRVELLPDDRGTGQAQGTSAERRRGDHDEEMVRTLSSRKTMNMEKYLSKRLKKKAEVAAVCCSPAARTHHQNQCRVKYFEMVKHSVSLVTA